jgi:hypothetical protein
MGVPTLEVGYTSATTGRGDHEVHKGHVVALEEKENNASGCSKTRGYQWLHCGHLQQILLPHNDAQAHSL